MRISDWSSDVCSSDLAATTVLRPACSAAVYRQALSLLIAQRRPSEYLLGGRQALAQLVDSHLRLLAEAGVIDAALRDAALAERARFTDSGFTAATPASPNSWKDRKSVVSGKSVSVRVALGGRRIMKNKNRPLPISITFYFILYT